MHTQQTKKKPQGRQLSKEKIIYKNQKRKTRNRLIYLVGLHLLFIFGFVGLLCVEYLIPRNWTQSFYFSVISDVLFGTYMIQTLVAIKFKNRKILITSITTLALAIGCKLGALIILLQNQQSDIYYLIGGHVMFLCLNIAVPWCLLLLWNKLKESKWR